jgi:hypothetical protein
MHSPAKPDGHHFDSQRHRGQMSWLFWLAFAVILTAIAAITGLQPKGTRSVAHTRMMGMGRLALAALVIILAFAAFHARAGG